MTKGCGVMSIGLAAGAALGRAVSQLLGLGNRLVGGALRQLLSSRLQRYGFIALARLNAPAVIAGAVISLWCAGRLYPYSPLVPLLIFCAALLSCAMWLRLAPNASFLVSSVYGSQLRVHLPDTALSPRDAMSVRGQFGSLVRVARLTRKPLHFDSPLLVADVALERLLHNLTHAAERQGMRIDSEVSVAREAGAFMRGSLSRHARRYDDLRAERFATGPTGGLLTRRVLVRMHRA
jgi:hypothetical protein